MNKDVICLYAKCSLSPHVGQQGLSFDTTVVNLDFTVQCSVCLKPIYLYLSYSD